MAGRRFGHGYKKLHGKGAVRRVVVRTGRPLVCVPIPNK